MSVRSARRLGVLGVAFTLVAAAYGPAAIAQKRERDPSVSPYAVPPKYVPDTTPPAPPPKLPGLTAEQIVEKNVAARGGLAKWRAVKSMTMTGKIDAGGKVDTLLPYTLQIKRPNKQRLAIEVEGQTALQIFDGEKGWKLRPYLNRTEPEPFSAEELAKTVEGPGLDGPLIDYAAKGNKVQLDGTESVEGKATYRLKLITKQGTASHIWIDGANFLEVKMQGHPRRFDGKLREVDTYLSDYHTIEGVQVPFMTETRLQGVKGGHQMTVENVVVNAALDDGLFVKPASLPNKQRVFTLSSTAGVVNAGAAGAGTPTPASK